MNICELRLYNPMGIIMERVSFMASPFAGNLNLRIPRPTKRQLESGNNLFRDGSDITESRYNNAVISLQPAFFYQNCTGEEAATKIEAMRFRIDRIVEEARLSSIRRTYNYVRFSEDTKGFLLESDIIDGDFDLNDDFTAQGAGSGFIQTASLSLVRRPFRVNPNIETIKNYISNPSFELNNSTSTEPNSGEYITGWDTNDFGAVINDSVAQVTDSIDGNVGVKMSPFVTSGGGTTPLKLSQTSLLSVTAGRVIYIEAWVRATGDNHWRMYGDNNPLLLAEIHSDEAITNPDPRWYRNRFYNREDVSEPTEFEDRIYYIRKGLFYKATGTSLQIAFEFVNDGELADISDDRLYIDRVYATDAINFLSEERYNTIESQLDTNVPLVLNPLQNPQDYEWMPKAWGSATYINNVFDTARGTVGHASTNYLDIDEVGGDVPADVELYVENLTNANAMRTLLAGMTSKGVQYAVRSRLGYDQSAAEAEPNDEITIVDFPGPSSVVVNSTSYPAPNPIFGLVLGTGRQKLSGSYHVIARLAISSSSLLKMRFLYQIGSSDDYIASREVTTPDVIGSAGLHYVSVDLGVLRLPDLEEDTIVLMDIQARRITAGTCDLYLDGLIFIPADEWYLAAMSVEGLSVGGYFRAGSFSGKDNLPVTAQFPTYFDSQAPGIEYVAGREPFIMPNRLNRIFFQVNHESSVYFESFKQTPGTIAYIKLRERYL